MNDQTELLMVCYGSSFLSLTRVLQPPHPLDAAEEIIKETSPGTAESFWQQQPPTDREQTVRGLATARLISPRPENPFHPSASRRVR
jgi:hypothetical protein